MKVALVFSGQPRWTKEAYEFHEKSLFEPNSAHETDVFAHFWFDESKIGKSCSEEIKRSPSKGKAVWNKSLISDFNKLYKPKRLVIDPPLDRKTFTEDFYITGGSHCGYEAISMFCSIKNAMALKKQEEIEFGFQYDLVLRVRPDMAIVKKILFDDVSKDTITILNSGLPYQTNNPAINCDFAMGNSSMMDMYSEIYDYIEQYIGEGCKLYGESLVFHHLYKNNFFCRNAQMPGAIFKNTYFESGSIEIDLDYIKRNGANWQGHREGDCWIIRDPSLH